MLKERHLQIIWSWWDLYFFLFGSWFLELGVRTPGFSYQRKISESPRLAWASQDMKPERQEAQWFSGQALSYRRTLLS